MNEIRQKLVEFAKTKGLDRIRGLPLYGEHGDKISVLLVGSAASGLCTEESDADICLLCDGGTFARIAEGTDWAKGRPTEEIIDGIQLHYYAISVESVLEKLRALDDISFFVYGTALPLENRAGLFEILKAETDDPHYRRRRYDRAVDVLTRRGRAFLQVTRKKTDPVLRLKMAVEMIEHVLTAVALADGIPFDRRKCLFETALRGERGQRLTPGISWLIENAGALCFPENGRETEEFIKILSRCANEIKEPAGQS